MNDRAEKELGEVAAGNRTLTGLLRAGRLFDELDRKLQPCLPESARGEIRVACVQGDCLVLAATSPAWASRARLLADGLLTEANRHLDKQLTDTRVIVVAKVNQ